MLPSREDMPRYVIDCFWVNAELTGERCMRTSDVFDKLRAALLLTSDDRHAGGKRTSKADESRMRSAIRSLREAGALEQTGRSSYSITDSGIHMAESRSPLSDDESRCRLLLATLVPPGSAGNRMFELLACRLIAKKTGVCCKSTSYVCDGGVDGVGTVLGKPVYYMQAKRYSGAERVGNPPVQQLAGCCLDEVGEGYLVTTSTFAQSAKDVAAAKRTVKIHLVDGYEVASLMREHLIGVTEDGIVDFDYFRWLLA